MVASRFERIQRHNMAAVLRTCSGGRGTQSIRLIDARDFAEVVWHLQLSPSFAAKGKLVAGRPPDQVVVLRMRDVMSISTGSAGEPGDRGLGSSAPQTSHAGAETLC